MAGTLNVRPLGGRVKIEADDIHGTINAIELTGNPEAPRVQYLVAWWDGNGRREEWVQAHEVTGEGREPLRIGFSVGAA